MESKTTSTDTYNKLIGKSVNLKRVVPLPEIKPINSVFSLDNVSVKKSEMVIILSHANTPERIQMLNECLQSINIEKLVSSNYPVDSKTQNLTDWLLYDKKNDLLFENQFEEHAVTYYHWRTNEDGTVVVKNQPYEHGYAVYNLIKNALLFCKSIDKDMVHIVNYDYLIPNELILENSKELNDNDLVVYEQSGEHQHQYCTGFFSGKIDSLLYFFQYYKNKKQYYADVISGMTSTLFIEGKMFHYYNTNKFKIKEKKISELKQREKDYPNIKLDRESLMVNPFFDDY
jgi:hypothetical protein